MQAVVRMVNSKQLESWLESPVTLLLISKIKEHKEAHIENIHSIVMGVNDLNSAVPELTVLKAQVRTLEYIENLSEFLEEVEDYGKISTDTTVLSS